MHVYEEGAGSTLRPVEPTMRSDAIGNAVAAAGGTLTFILTHHLQKFAEFAEELCEFIETYYVR